MSRRLGVSLVVAAALVLCTAKEAKDTPMYAADVKNGMELNEKQRSGMPDLSDMEVRRTLKCGICDAAVREFAYNVAVAEWEAAELGSKLRSFDYVDVVDKVCPEKMDVYGLVLKPDGTPSSEWSNEDGLFRAKGGQISRLVKNTCTEVQNEYEEELKAAWKHCTKGADMDTCKTTQVSKKLCGKEGLKFCDAGRLKDFQDLENLRSGVRDPKPISGPGTPLFEMPTSTTIKAEL